MAIQTFATALGAIGITGTAATVGAVMLQGGLIGGVVSEIAGGDFGEGFLMGAITGGAEWAVSGVLGSIAPTLGNLGNAIASSAIVAAGTGLALGQKDWLKQGLLGGAAAGIFYTAVDWTQKAFSKPAGAKPGSLVSDAKGNVFLIDSAGNGVHQKDMFALADDATKSVTIFDKAGNVVNSTGQAAKPSPIYADALAKGDIPPRVGLSQVGEIDGVAGTATYYTNGKATWTPINDNVGFGTTDIIDAGTLIRQDVTIDPSGLKPPSIEYTTASGYDDVRDMISRPVYSKVNVDGVDGTLTNWTYGDDVISTFKPAGSNNYIDVTDSFGSRKFVDGRGYIYEDGIMTNSRLTSGSYVDSSGMVYDGAGNPVAKLASAVDNSTNVDWSGTIGDGFIKRTNGDIISSESGKYLNGLKQGEFATDMTKSGQYYSKGSFDGKPGNIYDIGDGNLVFKPNDGSDVVGFQKNKVNIDYSGKITELAPSTTVDLTRPDVPSGTTNTGVPLQQPKTVPGTSQRMDFDGQTGMLAKLDNGDYRFSYMDTSKGSIDLPSSQVRLNSSGGVSSIDVPVASIDADGFGISASGRRTTQNFNGNYVDSAGMVYDDFGNPIAKIKDAIPDIDYSGTLNGGTITRSSGDVLDIKTTANTGVEQVSMAPRYNIDRQGQVFSDDGQLVGRINNPDPNIDYSGKLSADGMITKTDGSVIDMFGQQVKPPTVRPDVPPTAPVDTTPVAPVDTTPVAPVPQPDVSPPVAPYTPTSSIEGFTPDQYNRLQSTTLARTQGYDINAVRDFLNQGYTPEQIIRAMENNPNGGWANYNTGIRSMAPGGTITAPQPITPEVPTAPVDTTPVAPVDTTPAQPVVPQEPDVIEDIINNYRPTPVDTTPIAPIDTTPVAPVDTTPTAPVDTTPVAPIDTTPTAPIDITPPPVAEIDVRRPNTGDFTPPANQPYVDLNGNFVNSDGTLQGNNYQLNYVDRNGMVYDDFGNPAGRLVSATDPNVNYEGILQGNGAIKTPSGTYLDTNIYRPTQPAPVDTTPTRPITPEVPTAPVDTTPVAPVDTTPTAPIDTTPVAPTPDKPGYNYVDSSGTLYDQYGNPVRDVSGNYVDKDGIVYDEFGNPAGDLTPGQNPKPGTDLSGTLNKDGTITKPDGSVIDYNGNVVKPPTVPDKPVTPDKPVVGPGIVAPIVTNPTLNQPQTPTGRGYTLNWGTPPTINLPGVNPGIYAQAVEPYYTNTTAIQPQYYWGKHPYAATEADLANYNRIPGAPAQPFGAQFSAVGGNRKMDVNQFIQNYMDPQYQAGYVGSQPQFAGIPGTRSPVQAAPVAPVPPSAIPAQPQVQAAAPQFAAPARMSVNPGIGTLPPVSIPTWTKEGGLYYAVPTAAAV